MTSRRRLVAAALPFLLMTVLAACGGGSDKTESTTEASTEQTTATTEAVQATAVSLTAKDYSFDLPATFKGGLTRFSYDNAGKEPHFAAFAKIADGKTLADVKAALTAPPSATPPAGPPPFEDVAAFATGNPGVKGAMTVNMPAGKYALYCLIASPDGTPHIAKGMIQEVNVTAGTDGALPTPASTMKAVDFGFDSVPALKAGANVVKIRNEGKQLHEINLVELDDGKTVKDLVGWLKQESGPPPAKFLTGAAVKPGLEADAEFDVESGKTYAFVCAIPDFLGDFAPYATKGMYTTPISVP